jgi:hypothetical protein
VINTYTDLVGIQTVTKNNFFANGTLESNSTTTDSTIVGDYEETTTHYFNGTATYSTKVVKETIADISKVTYSKAQNGVSTTYLVVKSNYID